MRDPISAANVADLRQDMDVDCAEFGRRLGLPKGRDSTASYVRDLESGDRSLKGRKADAFLDLLEEWIQPLP